MTLCALERKAAGNRFFCRQEINSLFSGVVNVIAGKRSGLASASVRAFLLERHFDWRACAAAMRVYCEAESEELTNALEYWKATGTSKFKEI